VEADGGLASIRSNLQATDVALVPALLPAHEHMVCGQSIPVTTLSSYEARILSGRIEGAIRLCRVVQGDILDDTGIDPIPFSVTFQLGFDPHERPPAPGS
jgi:hypothetical protein